METFHNIRKGISRLYCAPSDLFSTDMSDKPPKKYEVSGAAHQALFADFLVNLSRIYPAIEEWWSSLVDAQMEEGVTRAEAIDLAFEKRLAGPAAAPEFVSLVRGTWLDCARLNAKLPEADQVPPEELMLGWLLDRNEEKFVQLLTCMPYWPIGLDENGNWC
jgi:hypothetical protein